MEDGDADVSIWVDWVSATSLILFETQNVDGMTKAHYWDVVMEDRTSS